MDKEKPKDEWFAEGRNANSNESLVQELAAHGLGHDGITACRAVPCNDGRKRDLLRLPSEFVTKVKRAKKGSDVLNIRFWKRSTPNALACPADFVEKGRLGQTVAHKSAAARLKAIKEAKSAL